MSAWSLPAIENKYSNTLVHQCIANFFIQWAPAVELRWSYVPYEIRDNTITYDAINFTELSNICRIAGPVPVDAVKKCTIKPLSAPTQ
jgi:hypothetical protein